MLTVVFCDSVLGGRYDDAPAVRQAMELSGADGELRVFAMPRRMITQQFDALDSVVASQPDLVIVSHGGSEAMTSPRPEGAGVTPSPTRSAPPNGRLARSARSLFRRANALRVRPGSPTGMSFADFEVAYRRFIGRLLLESSAQIILLTSMGSDPRYTPCDPAFRAAARKLIVALGESKPERLQVLEPQTVLTRWVDYRPDRAHLSRSGEAAVAQLLATAFVTAMR